MKIGKFKKIISIIMMMCMIITMVTPTYADRKNYVISGCVWEDSDGDGIRDLNENGIAGINIYSYNGNADKKEWNYETTSSSNGYYSVSAKNSGNDNIIKVDLDELKNKGYKLTTNQHDSKVNPTNGKSSKMKPSTNIHIGLVKIKEDTSPSNLMDISRSIDEVKIKKEDYFDIRYTIAPKPIPIEHDSSKKDIILVIDTSGSMRWIPTQNREPYYYNEDSRLTIIKNVAKNFVDKFENSQNFNIGLVEYSSYGCKVSDIISVPSRTQNLKSSIHGLSIGGATNIGDGIRTAKAMLDADTSAKEKYIILMTDGVPTAYSRDINGSRNYNDFTDVYNRDAKYNREYYRRLDDYMGSNINNVIYHNKLNEVKSAYYLGDYLSYLGNQEGDAASLNYAKNVVNEKIKKSDNITSFFVVGFGLGAGSSNEEIANAAGAKGHYYSSQDSNTLQNLYNQFAEEILNSISGKIHFEECITEQNNEQVSDILYTDNLPEAFYVDNNKIIGNMDITYKLNQEKTLYEADPVSFTVRYKLDKQGTYIFGDNKDSFANIDILDKSGKRYLEALNIEIKDKPRKPTFTQTPTAWTNQNVEVSIQYSNDSERREYKIDDDPWQTYNGPITVMSNAIIQARGIDELEQESIESISITNIDKVQPVGNIAMNPITNTNQDVTLTLTANDTGSGVKRVQKPDGTWVDGSNTTYKVSENGTYTFNILDVAGNVESVIATVNNIKKNLPEVNIKVRDTSGARDILDITSEDLNRRYDKILNQSIELQGEGYADISFKGEDENFFEYQFIKKSETPENIPINGWNRMDLNEETINEDVVEEKQGYLNKRSYDVSHGIGVGSGTSVADANEQFWYHSEKVFKNPLDTTNYIEASYSTSKEDYGSWETYTKRDGIESRIWKTNSIFLNNMWIDNNYREASKFWGYIKVDNTGDYKFGAHSDDGCRGYITANGETKDFVNMFGLQGRNSQVGTTNNVYHLESGKYYPIYLEYFNWGGSAAFEMKYSNNGSTWNRVPKGWFYPSKDITPGEYAKTIFTGNEGVKFPTESGDYYIAFRTGKDGDVTREGIYGAFTVEGKTELTISKSVVGGDKVQERNNFTLEYIIEVPTEIPAISTFKENGVYKDKISLTNIQITDEYPQYINIENDLISEQKIIKYINDIEFIKDTSNGETVYRYQGGPIKVEVNLSAKKPGNYVLSEDSKSKITFTDFNGKANREQEFDPINITVVENEIEITTGMFINGEFKDNSNVNLVKGFDIDLGVEIKNIKNQDIVLEIEDENKIDISNIQVNTGKDNSDVDIIKEENKFKIKTSNRNSEQKSNYMISYNVEGISIGTTTIKIKASSEEKTHKVNIVPLPNLE
ncbi:VWA domain-containing protein [Tepidibacter aestuarii]|uniref:VWA domain-containing protein n=1 Tax=Tepidibacter aestuarii TaxID=2925782 RepID=UPI0020C183DC|nr:VWA domain-containing protein [Tepidibacter aestuarii]CAH2214666.1 putative PA14 domain-containing protein [Tepidibacter aestuarii]